MIGLASTSLMLATQVAIDSTTDSRDHAIAAGLSAYLFEELSGLPYHDKSEGAFDATLGPETGETARSDFDDLDDFNGFTMHPITDEWGVDIGKESTGGSLRHSDLRFDDTLLWRAVFTVKYANASDPRVDLTSGTSGIRSVQLAIEKEINGGWTPISSRRRVFAYVPSP
jgi:hypothetical protein